jgi:quercetin dioxygenase-like cupin family protein
MKLLVDTNKVPFRRIERRETFPGVGTIPDQVPGVEEIHYKFFGRDAEKGPWIYVVKFRGGYHVPRHSHQADRLEYVLEGAIRFGNETLKAGGFSYITAGTEYEYDVVDDTTILLMFNGPPGLMM